MNQCELCGHIGPDVKEEQGKTYRYCCQDYQACEKRRQDAAAALYEKQPIPRRAL